MAQQQIKKMSRKPNRPIITWLQRKLGGSQRTPTVRLADPQELLPPPPQRQQSLKPTFDLDGAPSTHRSLPSVGSSWRNSNTVEADDDASTRPIPPTCPPSPVPSRSSSSFTSNPRTFMSAGATSTKATTLLSVDLAPTAMAHIAQVPSTPASLHNYTPSPSPVFARFPSARTSGSISSLNPGSSNAMSFSALPPASGATPSPTPGRVAALQAPLHTNHHPRNNPRPSSPPNDNASILTLASSAYAAPGLHSSGWAGDSQSHLTIDDSSHTALDYYPPDERDVDASVRALRPRSYRRSSWESEASRWSASSPLPHGEKSLKTTPSIRTNGWIPTDEGVESEHTEEGAEEDVVFKGGDESEKQAVDVDEHRTPLYQPQDLS